MTKLEFIDMIVTALTGIRLSVKGVVTEVPVFDYAVPADRAPDIYIRLTTYGDPRTWTKCGPYGTPSIMVDIVARYPISFGTRRANDVIREAVVGRMESLPDDRGDIIRVIKNLDTDFDAETETEKVFVDRLHYSVQFN